MSWTLEVRDERGTRSVGAAEMPLSLGGEDAAVQLPGEDGVVAWLGLAEGDLFIQPEPGQTIVCDGRAVASSHWIRAGERVGVGSCRLVFDSARAGLSLTVESIDDANRTLPPAVPVLTPPTGPRPGALSSPSFGRDDVGRDDGGEAGDNGVRAVEFRPARLDGKAPGGRRGSWLKRLVVVLALLVPAVVALWLFTARSVGLRVEPTPDRLTVSGWAPAVGERFLMLPGRYGVRAEKEGYRPLETEIEVGSEARQDLVLTLEKLPGRLRVVTASDTAGLPVTVNGEAVGETPLDLELPAGTYRVGLREERYRPFETEVELEGLGRVQTVTAELEPRWAPITVESRPPGARLRVDGEDRGTTPVTVELIEGTRRFELARGGYKPHRGKIEVTAGEAASVGPVALRPSDGNLTVSSTPDEAEVTVGGVYRGRTPLDLFLAPGVEHRLRITKAGYGSAEETVTVKSGEAAEVSVTLEQLRGRITVDVFPPDAEILVDGKPASPVDGVLELAIGPHAVAVRKDGYVGYETRITTLAGVPQTLEVRLESEEVARERKIRDNLETVEGHRLALIQPGRFQMGASRREPGRRANESLREVELTRRFYIGVHEVTNAQFRRFRSEHLSGAAGEQNLEIDHHPVVRVSWQDAVAYCNWLSEREGLPAAYVKSGDDWLPVEPMNEGFRLPTEAEWAFVARYDAAGEGPRKYPWGESLPPTEGAGNFADQSGASLVERALTDYRDGFPATAPVDAFGPDSRGVYQLGGNVAEWVHDVYKVRPAVIGAVERDPMGPPKGDLHVIRGSSWMHSTVTELRFSFRDYGSDPRPDLGFRIARYVEGPTP